MIQQGLLEGHKACATYLDISVADILLHPAQLDPAPQQVLLDEVEPVFTEADNTMICAVANKTEVKEVLWNSNRNVAPGTDGLTAFLYCQDWNILGNPLTEVTQALFRGEQPTPSQRTSLMMFDSKPKKTKSIKGKFHS